MKKIYLFLLLLVVTGSINAQQLSWRFANPYIIKVGSYDNLRFDVQVKCDVAGTYFWNGHVVLSFNNAVFTNDNPAAWVIYKVGDFALNNSQGNSKYSVTKGYGGSAPNFNIGISLNGDVSASPNGPNADDFTKIPTDWTTMITIQARLSNTSGDGLAGIDFVETAMNGQEFYISAPNTSTMYASPNFFDAQDFVNDYAGRFFSAGKGWSQVGNTSAAQWVNWDTNINTTIWDGTAAISQTDNTEALAKNVLVKSEATLTIPPLKELTISGNLTNNGAVVVNSNGLSNNGSLIVNGSSTGNVTFNRQMRTETNLGDYHYFSSPTGSNSAENAGKISAVWQWDEATGTAGNWSTVSITGITSGKGYNLDQTSSSDGLISFTGPVITSGFSVSTTSPYNTDYGTGDPSTPGSELDYTNRAASGRANFGGGGWNLLGNPFTSAMNATRFISTNSASFDPNYQAVFLYAGEEGTNGNYYYIASGIPGYEGSGTFGSNTAVQAGQGFFVLAMNNGVNFSFIPGNGSSGMQVHNTTVPLKSGQAPWPGLQLKVKKGKTESSTLIVFNEEMSTGLDPGYDIGQLSAGPEVEIYTALVKDNGINFARQALPLKDYSRNVVAVGVDCPEGGAVTFSASIIPIGNGTFYLEDRLSGAFTDLGRDSYAVTLPAKTSGTGRFFIQTSLPTGISARRTNPSGLNLTIWTSGQQVNIQGAVSGQAIGEVFDVLGRKMLETRLTGSTMNVLTIPGGVKGVYLVKVRDGANTCTQKVIF